VMVLAMVLFHYPESSHYMVLFAPKNVIIGPK